MLSDARYQRIKHVSLSPQRLKHKCGVAERVFASLWKKENERHNGINSGLALLELLLEQEQTLPGPLKLKIPPDITQRDAEVAASVIQWLGTNCGCAFIQQAEREIEKRNGRNRRNQEKARQRKNIQWEKNALKRELERSKNLKKVEKIRLEKEIIKRKNEDKRRKIRLELEAERKRIELRQRLKEEREKENPFYFISLED